MRLVFQLPASITSVVDAPRLVSSDASPTRPECAVTGLSTPAACAAAVNRNPIICADSGTTWLPGSGLVAARSVRRARATPSFTNQQRRCSRRPRPAARTLAGLRDRALVSVMLYSFARVSAVIGMRRQDYFRQESRGWLRPHNIYVDIATYLLLSSNCGHNEKARAPEKVTKPSSG